MSQYRKTSQASVSGRETECAAFNMINRELSMCDDGRSRVSALGRNHAMWSTLVRDLGLAENAMPGHLKTQLISLGLWSMRYSTKALLEPLPVQPLIDVNRNIAEGLSAQGGATVTDAATKAPMSMKVQQA